MGFLTPIYYWTSSTQDKRVQANKQTLFWLSFPVIFVLIRVFDSLNEKPLAQII